MIYLLFLFVHSVPLLDSLIYCDIFFAGSSEEESHCGDHWYANFLKRHPVVSKRITHAKNRTKMKDWTPEIAEKWIKILQELADGGRLDDPAGLWNLDESGFFLGEIWNRVLAIKGTKQVESSTEYDPKERLTVLVGGNAAGLLLRALILFDGKVQLSSRFEGTEDRCWIGVNPSGWMKNQNFTSYVVNELIPAMTADKVSKQISAMIVWLID